MGIKVFLSSCHYLLSKAMNREYPKYVSFRAKGVLTFVILLDMLTLITVLLNIIGFDFFKYVDKNYRLLFLIIISGFIFYIIEDSISDSETLKIRNGWIKQLRTKREESLTTLCLVWVLFTIFVLVPGSLILVAYM